MRLMDHSESIEEIPFIRGLKMVQSQPGLALFNVSYIGCFKMLEKGRVQLTPSVGATLSQKLKQAGILPEQIQRTPVILLKSEGYIAFSKDMPDTTVQKWQNAFEQVKKSGKYRELYEQYFLPEESH